MQKLHLGCGDIVLEGWVNLDIDSPVADILHDLTKPLPFADASVRYVFAEHMIEHIEYAEAESLLRECRRVLAPGGAVRMTTPDLAWLAMTYLSTITNQWGDLWQPRSPCALLNEGMRSWGHRYLYDRADLRAIFRRCGFNDIVYREWRSSEDQNLAGLESRPYNHEIVIEARVDMDTRYSGLSVESTIVAPDGADVDLLLIEQRRELDRLRLVIEERDDECKRILTAIGERDSNIIVMKEEISRLQEYGQSLIDELRNIREVFADRVAVIASKSALLIEKDQRVQFLENAIEDLARHNVNLEAGIRDCKRYIDTQSSELTNVTAESFERASLINELNDYIANSEKCMQAQSNEIQRYAAEASERVSLIHDLREKIADREASTRVQAIEIERVVAESSKRGLLIDSLCSTLEKSEAMNAECSKRLVITETELGRIQQLVDSLRMTLLGSFLLRRMKYESTTTESH